MANTSYHSYFDEVNSTLLYCVKAFPTSNKKLKNKHILCYRETVENSFALCRNIYYRSFMNRYFVFFPGEKYTDSYRKKYYFESEQWCDTDPLSSSLTACNTISKKDEELLIKHYPHFSYTLKKLKKLSFSPTPYFVLQVLRMWFKNPEIEYFIMTGFYNILLNKSLYKMKDKKNFFRFLMKNKDALSKSVNLRELQKAYKNKDLKTPLEVKAYIDTLRYIKNPSNETYSYILKQKNKLHLEDTQTVCHLYNDYIRLAENLHLDLADPYHLYPSSLQDRHDRLFEQDRNIREMEIKEKLKEKKEKYLKAVKKYLKNSFEIEGYKVFIPSSVEEIERQAQILGQCLISCDYISKVINRECLLVFIQKENFPVATAQIMAEKKLGQFYLDEHDRSKCIPGEDLKKVINTYVEKADIYFEKAA